MFELTSNMGLQGGSTEQSYNHAAHALNIIILALIDQVSHYYLCHQRLLQQTIWFREKSIVFSIKYVKYRNSTVR